MLKNIRYLHFNKFFFVQIKESTITGNNVLLMAHVQCFSDSKILQGEMFFADKLITDKKGTSIFVNCKILL